MRYIYLLLINNLKEFKSMTAQHTLRVRPAKWEKIEKKAWELSIKANKVIKPTDVADAILSRYVELITLEDVNFEKLNR